MKIQITLNDEDAFYNALTDAAKAESHQYLWESQGRRDAYVVNCRATLFEKIAPWVFLGDEITIEFDLDKQTATVVKRQQ